MKPNVKIRFIAAGTAWAACAPIIMFIPMPSFFDARILLEARIDLLKIFAIYFFIWLLIWVGIYFYARLTKRQASETPCKRIAFGSALLLFAAIWIALFVFLAGASVDNLRPLAVMIAKSWIGIVFASLVANFIYLREGRRSGSADAA